MKVSGIIENKLKKIVIKHGDLVDKISFIVYDNNTYMLFVKMMTNHF